jgi:hypothetical protein
MNLNSYDFWAQWIINGDYSEELCAKFSSELYQEWRNISQKNDKENVPYILQTDGKIVGIRARNYLEAVRIVCNKEYDILDMIENLGDISPQALDSFSELIYSFVECFKRNKKYQFPVVSKLKFV